MIDFSTYDDVALMRVLADPEGENAAAFTTLYHRHSSKLYINILSLVKEPSIAEELLQELFSRVWQKRQTIKTDNNVGGYLYRMGRNLVIDFYRKVQKDRVIIERLKDAGQNNYDTTTALDQEKLLKEQAELLQRAIASLSPQRRKIFELCKLEGKSYNQVAEELGISVNTVEVNMVKAKKNVRDHLSGQGEIAMALIIMLGILGE